MRLCPVLSDINQFNRRMQNVSGAVPTETFSRSCNRTRTYNLPVNSRLLCQLSYAGLVHICFSGWLATRPRGDNLSAFRGVRANWVWGGGVGVCPCGGAWRGEGEFGGRRAGYPGRRPLRSYKSYLCP